MTAYLFYDLETSGLNPAFDQVLTFAGIRTDETLYEIDRTCLTIALRKDIIPSPQAFVTHCLTPEALAGGMCEYEAAKAMHQLFNTPDTVSLGYNSLGFDDEFLRFLFYRNLLVPYSHQYADGCYRADILPMAALFRIFRDPVIHWPRLKDGRPTLKLERISRANRFETSGSAHDAMADVEALVALCQKFSGEKDIWNYGMGYFDKQTDLSRLGSIPKACRIGGRSFRNALMVSASFGPDAGYMAPVLHIGDAVSYKNQQLWIRLDRPECLETDPETGQFAWFPIRKKPGDQWLLLPNLERFHNRLFPETRKTAEQVLDGFRAAPERFSDTVQALCDYVYPVIPDLDPDASLYQAGFFSHREKKETARFHEALSTQADEGEGMVRILESVQSPRVKTLGTRILIRNFNVPANSEFGTHLESLRTGEKIAGYRNDNKYTLPEARVHLAELEAESQRLDVRHHEALDRIKTYIAQWPG